MCIDCNNNCLEEYSDKCVLYTGKDYDFLGVKNGEYYDKIIIDLIDKFEEAYVEPVDLEGITEKSNLNLNESLQAIVDKILALTSGDISYKGEAYCIGDSTLSGSSIMLIGSQFNYSVSPSSLNSSVFYDLTGLDSNLPTDYRLGRVSVVLSGQPKNGRTIITDSSKKSMGLTVDNDRFPLTLDVDLRVVSPNGDIKMTGTFSIPSKQAKSYVGELAVRDFTSSSSKVYKLKDFNEAVAAQVCSNKSKIDGLFNINLQGCSGLEYGGTDIKSILSAHQSAICSLLDRIETLENSSSNPCPDGGC